MADAKRKFVVAVSVGGATKEYTTEAASAKPESLGNGLMQLGDVTFREGALISIAPVQG